MAAPAALLFLLLAIPAVYGAQHVVGGSSGWTNFGVNYDTWSAGETFTVGDTLLFTYGTNHQLAEVTEANYNSCSASNAIETHSDGSTTIDLSKTGKMFFICPTGGHCSSGMKLAINVVAASTSPPTTSPAPPSTTTPPAAGTPPTTTPSTNTASPPPPSSPSGNGAAGILCNMNSLVLGSFILLGSAVALIG